MSVSGAPAYNPYATTPGSSTPGPGVTPEEGTKDLWAFFWFAIINTVVIAMVGVLVWFVVH